MQIIENVIILETFKFNIVRWINKIKILYNKQMN